MTSLLERFDALCAEVQGLDDKPRERAVREFLADAKRIEERERDTGGLLAMFDELQLMRSLGG